MKDDILRYQVAMHGIQSIIAFELGRKGEDEIGASPKHLRVGVDSAMINDKAMTDLLIAKGIITQEEYIRAIADAAEYELKWRTEKVRDETGMLNLNFG